MGKKLRNIIRHMMSAIMVISILFGSTMSVFAEKTFDEMYATDVLSELISSTHLFYDGEFADKFVVNTEPYLEIYSSDSTDSEVEGKIYPASYGIVEEWGNEWTKVTSGNVTGYIETKNIYTGYEAEALANSLGGYKATVNVESINIRQEADINSVVLGTAIETESFTVIQSGEEWTCISYGDGEGYVASEYVDLGYELDEALTPAEEISSRTLAEQFAFEAEWNTAHAGQQPNPELTEAPALSVTSDEEYLLACMVYVESGAECYEGQLAVANVILNRVRNPRFDDTIAEVIYAAGQFPGAHNGVLDNVLANGPSASCMKAAQEALAGVNNIGEYYYFNGYVDTSSVSSYTIIGGHTFYNF